MNILKKISFSQIYNLYNILCNVELNNKDYVKNRFEEYSLNFDDTLQFLSELKLVRINENVIEFTNKYDKIRSVQSNSLQDTLKNFVIESFTDCKSELRTVFNDFLSQFNKNNGRIYFQASIDQKLHYSGIRNLLLQLDFISYDNNLDAYFLEPRYQHLYEALQDGNVISYEKFKQLNKQKEQLGLNAELFVLDIEKRKFEKHPQLLENIEHTSIINVNAGYDIKSYEILENDKVTEIYIEVKAVSQIDFHFYFTKNEMTVARLKGDNYQLVLVPVIAKNSFDIQNMKIIPNPVEYFIENLEIWKHETELTSYHLKSQ